MIKENKTKEIENCKRLHAQISDRQELQNCYKNLVFQKHSYTLTKFSAKCNENTLACKLLIHRQAIADNTNCEIILLLQKRQIVGQKK